MTKRPTTPQGLTRRSALAGMATGVSLGGAALLGLGAGPARAARQGKPSLNLDDPADNCIALLKLQADIAGNETIGVFPGEAWAWVPGEGNTKLFKTIGIGVSRVEWVDAEKSWRFYHREALLYLDPQSGEVLESWYNPWTKRRVEVIHILNDHVNRYYQVEGGRFPFPWAHEINGDDLVFRISVFRFEKSVMPRSEYPLHSQNDNYQTTELWGMIGSLAEVQDPKVTAAACVTSWSRISGWLPFMEMGNAPGQIVYHSHSHKLRRGMKDINGVMPANVRTWLERNHPKYFNAPTVWNSPAEGIGIWKYSKALIDERRRAGLKEGQTPFSWPRD